MGVCKALVLGGGGARGALQVGAVRALFEAGYRPDLLVGASIGAINATGLALWGTDLIGAAALEQAYQEVAKANFMEPRLSRLTLRALAGRPNRRATERVAEYMITKGITPDLCFKEIGRVRLGLVGADLDSGEPVIYGLDPEQKVLEGLLSSMALPPWFAPVEASGHFILDGGIVSNLPIEPALQFGATEIIALDLDDPSPLSEKDPMIRQVICKLIAAVSQRYVHLETALAEARGVPVRRIVLRTTPPVPIWDFRSYPSLIQSGYDLTVQALADERE